MSVSLRDKFENHRPLQVASKAKEKVITMGIMFKSLLAGLMGAAAISAQCTAPPANDATVSLIAEFEGWSPDICSFSVPSKV